MMIKIKLKHALTLMAVIMIFPAFGQRIDTHIHLYNTDREGSSTFLNPVKHEKIYFPHYAQTFVDTAGPAGIDYAVVVEASKRREDNFWLMQHVDTSDAMLAFIANLDPRDPSYVADLDSLSTFEKFRGIRIRPATPINIADNSVMASFAHLARKNLVLEIGRREVDPKTISTIARRYPNMNIIMNHMAGGSMDGDQIKPSDWVTSLEEFASEPNVYCKISMLYGLSGQNPAPTDAAHYKPFIDPVVDAFGPDRVIFGSNWTLSDMYGTYGDMIAMYDAYLATREDLSPEQLYFENVNRAYGINQEKTEYTGTGNGLFRSYWNGTDGGREWFADSLCGAIVPNINVCWDEGSPACGLNESFWNARWIGSLEPLHSGLYTFYLTVNDYAKMWMDGEVLMDGWTGTASFTTLHATMDLVAGTQVSIQVDFANISADAFITLEWEGEGLPKDIVPQAQLYVPVTTSLSEATWQHKGITIYPIPAERRLIISSRENEMEQLIIRDLQGRVIYKKMVDSFKLELDVSCWAAGIYMVETMQNGNCLVQKILIN